MRGGKLNADLQEYGVLAEYRKALEFGAHNHAERIRSANPQVHVSKFDAIYDEITEKTHGPNEQSEE